MADVPLSPPGRRLVARHEVRRGLREMILNGEHRPGAKLVQQELAKRFGVAQGVVREALLELQVYGLVETVDNRGMFVSQLNKETLLDAFDVREVHEGLAVRLCTERVTRLQLRELHEVVEEIYGLAVRGTLMKMASLDRAFHYRLVHLSGNSMLIRLADNYGVLGKVIQLSRDPEAVRTEHRSVLRAIEGGRPDEAEQLMREHIRTGKRALEEEIARGRFVPRWLAGPPEARNALVKQRPAHGLGRVDCSSAPRAWRTEDEQS